MIGRIGCACALVASLAGCGSTPAVGVYVLSPPVLSLSGVSGQPGAGVQLQPVLLPDYLDSTDILTRIGTNQLHASTTGRWGERLSEGLTHAIVASLRRLLPQDLVTLGPPTERSARQVLVNVEAFDVNADGGSVLTARWTVLDRDGAVRNAGRGSFVSGPATPGPAGDAAIVASMADAVEQLAGRIALAVS